MELPAQLGTALSAVNSGDGLAFASCFTPRVGVVDDWGATFRGAEAIHGWCADRFTQRSAQIELVHAYPTEEGNVMIIANITEAGAAIACTLIVSLRDDGTIATMRVMG
jgi:hypothetical protein